MHCLGFPFAFTSTCTGFPTLKVHAQSIHLLEASIIHVHLVLLLDMLLLFLIRLMFGKHSGSGCSSNRNRTPNPIQLSVTSSAPISHQKPSDCRNLSRLFFDPIQGFPAFASAPNSIARLTAAILPSPSASSPSFSISGALARAINPNTKVCFLRAQGTFLLTRRSDDC
jgi:hypothetical protein